MSDAKTIRQKVRAARGTGLSCKGWRQEGVLRLLMNCVDADVAEGPDELVTHGSVKAARDWEAFGEIVAALRQLEGGETLTIRDGGVAGLARTEAGSPSVIVERGTGVSRQASGANSSVCFSDQVEPGWAYVGAQSFFPAAYELYAEAARQHFGGTLAGRLVLCGGMGGIGGAQPLAASLCGAAFLGIDVDPARIKRRVKSGYCDVMVNDLDEALRILKNAVRKHEPTSVGLIGNCAEVIPELASRGVVPDLAIDLTPGSDRHRYVAPESVRGEEEDTRSGPAGGETIADSIRTHALALLDLQKLGSVVLDSGNGLFAEVPAPADALKPANAYLRALLDEGRRVAIIVALAGEASDIVQATALLRELFHEDEMFVKWIDSAGKSVRDRSGLPARTCWLTTAQVSEFTAAADRQVAGGKLKGPITVIAELDSGLQPAMVESAPGGRMLRSVVLDGKGT